MNRRSFIGGLALASLIPTNVLAQQKAQAQRFKRHVGGRPQLWWKEQGEWCWTCLHDMRVDFQITEPSILDVKSNFSLVHRFVAGNSGPIGYGIKFALRHDPTGFSNMPAIPVSSVNLPYWQSAMPGILWGSKRSGNIASHAHHYSEASPAFEVELIQPGCYRLEAFGNAHSSAWPDGTNGLIELNQNVVNGVVDPVAAAADPYSYLFATVRPAS